MCCKIDGSLNALKIASTDSDEGQNAETMYSLTPDNKSDYKSFTIDRHTGVINTTAVFDRESKGKYTITIRATDQPLSGQARWESYIVSPKAPVCGLFYSR